MPPLLLDLNKAPTPVNSSEAKLIIRRPPKRKQQQQRTNNNPAAFITERIPSLAAAVGTLDGPEKRAWRKLLKMWELQQPPRKRQKTRTAATLEELVNSTDVISAAQRYRETSNSDTRFCDPFATETTTDAYMQTPRWEEVRSSAWTMSADDVNEKSKDALAHLLAMVQLRCQIPANELPYEVVDEGGTLGRDVKLKRDRTLPEGHVLCVCVAKRVDKKQKKEYSETPREGDQGQQQRPDHFIYKPISGDSRKQYLAPFFGDFDSPQNPEDFQTTLECLPSNLLAHAHGLLWHRLNNTINEKTRAKILKKHALSDVLRLWMTNHPLPNIKVRTWPIPNSTELELVTFIITADVSREASLCWSYRGPDVLTDVGLSQEDDLEKSEVQEGSAYQCDCRWCRTHLAGTPHDRLWFGIIPPA